MLENGVAQEKAILLGKFFNEFYTALRKEVEKGSEARDFDLIDFQERITSNLTAGTAIRVRGKILLKKLLLFDPSFSELLAHDSPTNFDLYKDVPKLVERIESLIHSINTAYSGTQGEDLFKATNDSVKSLSTIRTLVKSFSQYEQFIDSLYFLIFESTGSGKRYGDEIPGFVEDVRDLRTHLRHDVNHGKPKDIARKRKHLADTFRRYSGVNSPEVLPDAAFPVVQVKLLSESVNLLDQLQSSYQESVRL